MDLSQNAKRDILSHWLWTVPILLVVAALAIRQIDLYAHTPNEFMSMYNSGWLVNSPYLPIDVIQSIQQNSPQHTPGYFLLLNLWGSLTTYDIALARVFTIFTGLLSLAMVYRLARDFVAPLAGLLAVIVVISNAFYNFYFVYVRMYPLLVLISGIVLWLYLRITHQHKRVKQRDYLVLGAATFCLLNTHAFSAVFLIALGAYHLLIAPKNQHWLRITATVVTAAALFSPWAAVLIKGANLILEERVSVGGLSAIHTWLTVSLNNQAGLLLLSIVGLLFGIRYKLIKSIKPWIFMAVLYLIVLALLAEFTTLIRIKEMRYQLVGWLPLILVIAAGLYALVRFRKWLVLLVILWMIAGFAFQRRANWGQYLGGLMELAFDSSPMQVISRLALQAEQHPTIIGYVYPLYVLKPNDAINYSIREHYFGQHGIHLELPHHLEELEEYARQNTTAAPSLWVFYQTSKTKAEQIAQIKAIMGDLNYQLCDTRSIAVDTVILQYMWQTLDCQPPQLLSSHQTTAIDYQFYGAALDTANSKLYFNDQWTARTDDDLSGLQMSYQLISADWNKSVQLDLPLVHEGQLRQFFIDIANVPSGQHRLMAILYDKDSDERQNWLNRDGDLPAMLTLTEIDIPAR